MNSFVRKDIYPPDLLAVPLTGLAELLGGPTLFYLQGKRSAPLFVSTLLHGNEPSGFLGVQKILNKYKSDILPRSLILLIGNVHAARDQVRMLPGQPDFNRIWRGHQSPEGQAANDLLAELKTLDLFAAVDIHDNTGTNPHYACVSKSATADLQMAALFNHIAVYFTYPDTTMSVNLSQFCPAVTIECGKAGTEAGIERAANYIESLMHHDHFSDRKPTPGDLTMFRAVARMKVRSDLNVVVGDRAVSGAFVLPRDLDHLNFSELKKGHVIGYAMDQDSILFDAAPGVDWCDSRKSCLRFSQHCWTVNKPFTPGMFTLSAQAVRDDCLGYIMEPMTIC